MPSFTNETKREHDRRHNKHDRKHNATRTGHTATDLKEHVKHANIQLQVISVVAGKQTKTKTKTNTNTNTNTEPQQPAIQLKVAGFDHNSLLPPQASYHRRVGKAGSKSLWQSKNATLEHWKSHKLKTDIILLEVLNIIPTQNNNKNNKPKKPNSNRDTTTTIEESPRATKWIVEKRQRSTFFDSLAIPKSTTYTHESKIDPRGIALLRAKSNIGGNPQNQAGWTKDHHDAIHRLDAKLHRSRFAAGLEVDEEDSDLDSDDEKEHQEDAAKKRQQLLKSSPKGRLDDQDFVKHHRYLLNSGAFSTRGKELQRSFHAYELSNKINTCKDYIINEEYQKINNPLPTRRERAKIKRERQEQLTIMIKLIHRTSVMEKKLMKRRQDKRLYLLRTMTAMKIQAWFRKKNSGRRDERLANAIITIRKFVRICLVGWKLRNKKRSVDTIQYFFENYAKQNVSNLIGKFRNKIIRGQRCWKSYSKISAARMILLQKLWDLEEQRLHDGEKFRKEKELKEQFEFEAELINDSNGNNIAATVLSATKRRLRQNNISSDHDKSKVEGGGVDNLAMHLLKQRTQRVLESTKYHMNVTSNVPDHLTASKSIRFQLLKQILRQKRLKYQETLEKVTHRLIAKRQTTVLLTVEDVRRFLQSGETIKHIEEHVEEEKYTGLLLLQSLEENEIRTLVAKGIFLTTGFVVSVSNSSNINSRSNNDNLRLRKEKKGTRRRMSLNKLKGRLGKMKKKAL